MTRDLASYRDALTRFYTVWRPLEDHLAQCAAATVTDLTSRLRADKLASDLKSLDISPDQLALKESPFSRRDIATFAGILYVLEGSRHGGKTISRVACEKLPVTPDAGCSFFAQDPATMSRLWQDFLAWTHTLSGPDIPRAADTAAETFQFIQTAFR